MLAARRRCRTRAARCLGVAGVGAWLAVMAGATALRDRARRLGHRAARHRAAGDARRPRADRRRRGGHHRRRRQRGAGHPAGPGRRGPASRRSRPRRSAALTARALDAASSRSSPLALAVGPRHRVSPFASSSPGRAREGRRRQGVPRPGPAARRPGGLADPRLRRSRASTTRAWPPASPASSARCCVFGLGYGARRRGPPPDGRGDERALHHPSRRASPATRRARSTASTRGRSSSGSRRSRSSAVSTPLQRLAGLRRLRRRAGRDRGRSRASRPRSSGARARVVLPLVLFVAAFVPFVRGGDGGRARPALASPRPAWRRSRTVTRQGRDRHAQRRPARRDDELPGRPARARAAARAAAAHPDRRVHVPLPVRDRRRGRGACAPRSPPAATARATRCRPPRIGRVADRAVPAHLRARRARLPGDARPRLRGAHAAPAPCSPSARADARLPRARWLLIAAPAAAVVAA